VAHRSEGRVVAPSGAGSVNAERCGGGRRPHRKLSTPLCWLLTGLYVILLVAVPLLLERSPIRVLFLWSVFALWVAGVACPIGYGWWRLFRSRHER
jgi:hypothetical protein